MDFSYGVTICHKDLEIAKEPDLGFGFVKVLDRMFPCYRSFINVGIMVILVLKQQHSSLTVDKHHHHLPPSDHLTTKQSTITRLSPLLNKINTTSPLLLLCLSLRTA